MARSNATCTNRMNTVKMILDVNNINAPTYIKEYENVKTGLSVLYL